MSDPVARLQNALSDRYRIERELGRGGMATVYLAHDLRQERLVALKVIHPELTATLGPERFLREIKLTANLRHPHILPLFDSGEAGGQLWYTMPMSRESRCGSGSFGRSDSPWTRPSGSPATCSPP